MDKIGLVEIGLWAVTVIELFQGMGNKNDLVQMKNKIKFYNVVQMESAISEEVIEFIEKYKPIHGLKIPDVIIGTMAVVYQIPPSIYNVRDFDFLPGIVLYQAV